MSANPFEDSSLITSTEAEHKEAVAPYEGASDNVRFIGEAAGIDGAVTVEYIGDQVQQAADQASIETAKAEQQGEYGQAGSR